MVCSVRKTGWKFVHDHNNVDNKMPVKCSLKYIWSLSFLKELDKGFYVQILLKIEKLTQVTRWTKKN